MKILEYNSWVVVVHPLGYGIQHLGSTGHFLSGCFSWMMFGVSKYTISPEGSLPHLSWKMLVCNSYIPSIIQNSCDIFAPTKFVLQTGKIIPLSRGVEG